MQRSPRQRAEMDLERSSGSGPKTRLEHIFDLGESIVDSEWSSPKARHYCWYSRYCVDAWQELGFDFL